ncbi:MAG TPA: NHL repeat-containing protein [bacterium]|nr:NHL repeat-containing protein [bacterium]HQP97002.1 NHL repeat-containing protein [bacterium]
MVVHAESETPLPRASIRPSLVRLQPGATQAFKIIRMAAPLRPATLMETVTWSVNGIRGGNKTFGTIDDQGVYRAPNEAPSPPEIHIIGEVTGVANRTLFATVMMESDRPLYEMTVEFSEPLKGAKYFNNPHCVTLDIDGNLLIADYDGSRVLRFSPEGKYLGDLGNGIGEEPGQVHLPRVVLVDNKGDIYVSDLKQFGPRVQVFSNKGKYLYSFAEKGTGSGEVLRAHGMDFNSLDQLFLVDVDAMRVNVYTHDGCFLRTWGRDGPDIQDFNAPHGLVIDPNDDVFVSNYYGTIQKFTPEGEFLYQVTRADPPDGSVYVHSICGDRWGNLYAMVRGQRGFGGEVEVSKGKLVSLEKYNNNGDYIAGITLTVKAHAENWAHVDDKDNLYFIYRGEDTAGFEIFAHR